MKHLTDTIREALNLIDHNKWEQRDAALTALSELEAMVGEQEQSLAFYKRRCDALQQWQSKMRDPERTIVCDILANGHTLEPAGNRYAAPPAQQPQAEAVPFNHATQLQIAYVKGLGDGAMQVQPAPGEAVRDTVVAEREACAVLAQQYASQVGDLAWSIAAAIRARGKVAPQQAEAVPSDVVRDAARWRTFLATRPANTHAVINQAIDDAATRKGGGV